MQINPLLQQAQHGYPLPTQFDFHSWPAADILAPLYRHEQEAARTLKLVLGRRRDPHLVDKSVPSALKYSRTPAQNHKHLEISKCVANICM